MRCGVHVVTKIHRCGGAVRAYSRAIAVFRFFDPIFRFWITFTRPFGSSDRPPKLSKTQQKKVKSSHYGEKTREERAGHALSLVLYNTFVHICTLRLYSE